MGILDRLSNHLTRFRSDIVIGRDVYMRRWKLTPERWPVGLRVHHILRSDADRELHDHPFDFVSVIVRGGYVEVRACPDKCGAITMASYGPGAVLFRRAEDLHRLELVDGRPAWTVVVRGPLRRQWGFMTAAGWQHWRDFTAGKNFTLKGSAAAAPPGSRPAASSIFSAE